MLAAVPVWAGTTANSVVSFTGTPDANFPDPTTALGPITGDTGVYPGFGDQGGLNPFNPVFSNTQMVQLDPGDSLTLHLSAPVAANDGAGLGVFSSVGLIDTSGDGSGTAGTPATSLSTPSSAIVSVSQDGINFYTLNNGNPIAFSNPSNAYLNTPISGYYQNPSGTPSNMSKPFLGTVASFSGENYSASNGSTPSILQTLDGSAGGTWINLNGVGVAGVNFVKFSVPAGASYTALIDAVAGADNAGPIVAGKPIISESVGSGSSTSSVVVDFGTQSFDFLVSYNGSISGVDALNLIEAGSYFTFADTVSQYGAFVTGFDYGGFDENGNGAGGSAYWHYFTSADGINWTSSGVGASSRMLTNGSYDGWDFSATKSAPVTPLATVPEPATAAGLIAAVATGVSRRRRRR
jgi:hypothetical protein